MQITCPNCNNVCEVEEEPAIGQHLLCPLCDTKFSYSPQSEDGVNADGTEDAASSETYDQEFIVNNAAPAEAREPAECAPYAASHRVSGRKKFKAIRTEAKTPAATTKKRPIGSGKRIFVVWGLVSGVAAILALCGTWYFCTTWETTAQKNRLLKRNMNGPTQETDEPVAVVENAPRPTEARNSEERPATITLPPGAPSELLLKYAELGETDYIRAVLEQNPNLDVNRPRTAENKTALYLACEKGFPDIVELLLKKNADATICDAIPGTFRAVHEYSPITIAAKNGHHAILKILLASGKVDIESRDGNNRTALYAAAANNQPEAVKILCQSKAKVNIQGLNKWTPLTAAASSGYADVVKVLLQYGDKVDLEMPGGWPSGTALLHAVQNNHPKVVEILCKAKAKVNIHCPPNNLTPLMESIDMGYTEVVKALLKYGNGLDVEMRGGSLSETALHRAVSKNNPGIVELLCKAGANVHTETGTYLGDLTTPLGRARYKGYSEVVKILERYK